MKGEIRRFRAINEFFETTGFHKRTDIAEFFVFRLDELTSQSAFSMPPYQKDFYQVTLILNSEDAVAAIDTQTSQHLENTLYFLSPNHIFSWQRHESTSGFIVYFKADFLSTFNGSFRTEFSLFELSSENFLKLNLAEVQSIISDFEKLHREYYAPNAYRFQILQSSLLSLLFKCKSLDDNRGVKHKQRSKREHLVFRFQNLVSNSFLQHKKVADYAILLNISSNALNQAVKSVLGRSAKQVISDRVVQEAMRLLTYSTNDISEISYSLGFDEPTHFIRFFKKMTSTTPKEYRLNQV
jgi:AraC family transcriptional regulator, transcriptional activator of pobA